MNGLLNLKFLYKKCKEGDSLEKVFDGITIGGVPIIEFFDKYLKNKT